MPENRDCTRVICLLAMGFMVLKQPRVFHAFRQQKERKLFIFHISIKASLFRRFLVPE